MTVNIDWSKAPAEATHFLPADGAEFVDTFWRMEGVDMTGVWRVKRGIAEMVDIGTPFITPASRARLIARPAGWSGKGKPPVDIEIEMKYKAATAEWAQPDFHPVTLAWVGSETFVTSEEKFGNLSDVLFRPVRTPDQIAADGRAAEVAEMIDLAVEGHCAVTIAQARILCTQLHKAGYRKQEQSK